MKLDWINIPLIEEETHEEIGSIQIHGRVEFCEVSEAPYFTISHYKLNDERFKFGTGPIDNTIMKMADKYWTAERLAELFDEEDSFASYRDAALADAAARRREYREQVL